MNNEKKLKKILSKENPQLNVIAGYPRFTEYTETKENGLKANEVFFYNDENSDYYYAYRSRTSNGGGALDPATLLYGFYNAPNPLDI